MLVRAKNLEPGMVLDEWDAERGADSTVAKVRVIERPGMRYRTVRIEMASGRVLRPFPTEVCQIDVVGRVAVEGGL